MPGRLVCTLEREEVNREALVQKNRTLLAKSIQSSRSRSVVNLVLGNEEVSTARKDELLTHPCVGRVEVAFDGTLPNITTLPNGCASGLEGTHFISDRGWQTCPGPTLSLEVRGQTQCFATGKESARFICVDSLTH